MKDSKQPMNKPAPTGSRLTSLGSSALARSRSFLRAQDWIWPLIAAVILVFVGVFVRLQMEGAMKTQIAGNLKTILNANTESLRAWAATEKSRVEAISEDVRVAELVAGIVQRAGQLGVSTAALLGSPQLAQLRTLLQPELEHYGFNGYVVLDPDFVVIATGREELIGMKSVPGYEEHLRRCLEGEI